jgi:ElaB/YqjD/DUF883 family membrane-anchored ribosome-binding protein
MTEGTPPENDLADELRALGDNLKTILQTAWESEEAKKLRQEIEAGLTDLGKAATEAVNEFNASETGQRFKADVEDFKTRVESGEVETKARSEIHKVLRTLNTELKNAASQWETPEKSNPEDNLDA